MKTALTRFPSGYLPAGGHYHRRLLPPLPFQGGPALPWLFPPGPAHGGGLCPATTDAPPSGFWLILSTYASFIEAQGWELVARYYQRRLDAPDDASSMDPTRYTLRAMLDCLRQAEEEGALLPGWSVE